MAVAIGDVFQVIAGGLWQQQQIRLTLTYVISQLTAAPTEAQVANSMIQQVGAQPGGANIIETAYKNLLPTNYTLDFWACQKIYPTRWRLQILSRAVPGLNAGACNAPNQAAVVTLTTDQAGRSQQSNLHVGPIPQDNLTQVNGLVTFAYSGLLGNFATQRLAGLASVPVGYAAEPCIYHRGRVPAFTVLTGYEVGATLRVMRRRTVGVGK